MMIDDWSRTLTLVTLEDLSDDTQNQTEKFQVFRRIFRGKEKINNNIGVLCNQISRWFL